jgi:two-component system cell cycle sensor histidine kinase/response regulator CckA
VASDDTRLAVPRRLHVLKDWLGLPLVALLSGLLAVLLVWSALRAADRERTRAAAEGLARSASADVERTLLDYERIFADVRARRGMALAGDSGWRLELVGLHATGWADPAGVVAWATPPGREHLRGLRLGDDARVRAALDESRRTGRSLYAGPALPDVAGGPYVLLLLPVTAGAQPPGHLVGFFEPRQLVATALRHSSTLGSIAVEDGERALGRVGSAGDGGFLAQQPIDVLGAAWTVRVRPDSVQARADARLGVLVLGAGALIVVLLAAALGFSRTARRRARQAVAAEAQYRVLFEANPLPMWVYEPASLRFLFVNDAAVAHYGYSREEFLAMTIADIRPPEDHAALLASVERSHPGIERAGVWRHRLHDGTLIEVDVSSHDVTLGSRPGRLVLARDVTEQKRLEDQVRQSQKLEAIGRLAGGVAHDFNNILGVILGYGGLLLRGQPAGSPGAARVEQILKAAERGAGLTRQLLAFGRRQILQPRLVDPNALVQDLAPMLRRLIGEDVELTIAAHAAGTVEADPGQLEQVIMNLVVNARDAMPRGGHLAIRTEDVVLDEAYASLHPDLRAGCFVMLAVSDTGHGMTAETMGRAFEPFFTTKDPEKGTGLGLATVHGIVRQSGGHVFVYSEVGRGTTFKVYLPRVATPEEDAAPAPVVPAPAEGGSETILVVEDEDALRALVAESLREAGYTVIDAETPARALALSAAEARAIDLLVTDVVLPGLSGRELSERLCAARPALKVLFMSGYTDDAVVRHGIESDRVAFLQKPFPVDGLLRLVRRVLGPARA